MKRVITEQDVEGQIKNNAFSVDRDAILTPGAREYLSRKGIQVTYETSYSQASTPVTDDALARIIEEVVSAEVKAQRGEAPPPPGTPRPAVPAPTPAVPSPAAAESLSRGKTEGNDQYLGRVLDAMHQTDVSTNRAIVTVVGRNTPGIVARISTAVAEAGGDLADMNQVIVGDYFSLIFVVDLAGVEKAGHSFRLFKERLQNEAAAIGCVKTLVMHEDIFKAMHKV